MNEERSIEDASHNAEHVHAVAHELLHDCETGAYSPALTYQIKLICAAAERSVKAEAECAGINRELEMAQSSGAAWKAERDELRTRAEAAEHELAEARILLGNATRVAHDEGDRREAAEQARDRARGTVDQLMVESQLFSHDLSDCIGVTEATNAFILKRVSEMAGALDQASTKIAELTEALRGLTQLVDADVLVRDTSKDHEPDWAIKQLKLVGALQVAYAVLGEGGENG